MTEGDCLLAAVVAGTAPAAALADWLWEQTETNWHEHWYCVRSRPWSVIFGRREVFGARQVSLEYGGHVDRVTWVRAAAAELADVIDCIHRNGF